MNETSWAEITCIAPNDLVDQFSDFLVELTGCGVSIENRNVDTFSQDDIADLPTKEVKAYAPATDDVPQLLAKISAFLADAGAPSIVVPTVTMIQEEDWANNWKAYFKPTRIGSRLIMKPSWETYAAAADDIILELDPGMAFGTGTHGTTRLCLEALERILFQEGVFADAAAAANSALLDVGCGSGVLAIAGAKFGSRKVTAVDIDPVAVAVTKENASLNGVDTIISASTTPLEAITGQFQIVLANILAEELVRLAAELIDRVADHGWLILSGILQEREAFVIDGFAQHPLTLAETTHADDWSCLVYRKRP